MATLLLAWFSVVQTYRLPLRWDETKECSEPGTHLTQVTRVLSIEACSEGENKQPRLEWSTVDSVILLEEGQMSSAQIEGGAR